MRQQKLPATRPDRASVLSSALLRAVDILGLKQASLASILGLSEATVSRLRNGSYQLIPESKAWELATLLVRLYRGLDAIMAGDETALRAWLHNANKDLHGVPAELINSVTGLSRTIAYVDAHRARV